MNSSGIKWGVAASAASALAVAGLPLLAGTAHAEFTEVVIVNERNRTNFDTDELRDKDDFTIETRDELGEPVNTGLVPDYRWILDPEVAGEDVEGNWIAATPRRGPGRAGRYLVYGPSRTQGTDGINDKKVQDGTWTLEARVMDASTETVADPVTVTAAESEVAFAGEPATAPAEGEYTASGTLANNNGALAGRAVTVTYTRTGGGDARIKGGAGGPVTVITNGTGAFSVTLEDPDGPEGESGALVAVSSGEALGDATQLRHDYGPDDSVNEDADAEDDLTMTWRRTGPPNTGPARIVAKLAGKHNGRRADLLKVVAPGKARGAEVRLFRAGTKRLKLLQVKELNRRGDRLFRVADRNGPRLTKYVAKVRATDETKGDRTNRRRVR